MVVETTRDDIKIVTLKNGKTNPFNKEMLLQLKKIIDEVNASPTAKGIILTGDGRFFSSGFDLPIFINFKELKEAIDFFEMEEEVLLALFTCEKPVVSAINGHCAAAGLIYSMAADYRIAKNHPKIKIGMSEIKIGLGLSIAQHEVMSFGIDSDLKFRDVMYFGEMVGVERAKEMQLIDEVVEEDQLIDRAKQIITTWIDTPNRPFIQMKRLLRMDTAKRIQKKLKEENWQDGMNTFFKEDVRQTLEFVQASMA
ncbi:MAG: enoyl-CoA hydratase/isomerase family protein [Desulfobacteraceae bacterium]|jgi:enoyl-CoA hydratase/carnithine racemase|nr:enoyl-CoA hydratase/isomerase family protein [Desulfobacteraceae bacterium]